MTFTDQDAHNMYSKLNGDGKGFGIGEDEQDAVEALENEGYSVVYTYSDNLIEATKDGWRYLVGSDGLRRGAWAVRVRLAQVSDVEDYLSEPRNGWTTRG